MTIESTAKKSITIDIPYGIATDVIHLLNRSGYVLFSRPDSAITVTAGEDACMHEFSRRGAVLAATIQGVEPHEAARAVLELAELFLESCERFGPETWISQQIAQIAEQAMAATETNHSQTN